MPNLLYICSMLYFIIRPFIDIRSTCFLIINIETSVHLIVNHIQPQIKFFFTSNKVELVIFLKAKALILALVVDLNYCCMNVCQFYMEHYIAYYEYNASIQLVYMLHHRIAERKINTFIF